MCSRLRLTAFFWCAAEYMFAKKCFFHSSHYLSITEAADQLVLFLRICIIGESNIQVVYPPETVSFWGGCTRLLVKVIEQVGSNHPFQEQWISFLIPMQQALEMGSLLSSSWVSETF
jgi:hypothetical protein